ncbi:type II secretion system F family protein [Tundrisphaera lichenicola]|uniref:type II secretion system F family protein n=1 Tax=Tundrisphaera lichenicola TaxID=2029860 RepID=UPI003EBAA726
MPLEPGVRAFSAQAGGMYRVWTSSLADLLHQGVPLAVAIESIPRVLTPEASFLIRIGGDSGDLPGGLREATIARAGRSSITQGIATRIAYLSWVVLIGQGIVGFVLYFIVPKFEAIFNDFGIELPELTRFVISISHSIVDYGWIVFFPLIGYLIYLPFALLSSSNVGIPLFDRLFPRKHTILLLRTFALVVDSGRPIVPALESMAEWYPTGWVRRKLHQASRDAEQGVEWSEALHSCGLLSRADLDVIEASTRVGNLPWSLRELAESGERRLAYRLQIWSQLLFILMVLALGLMVFVLSVAFFMPLTTLIQRLSA